MNILRKTCTSAVALQKRKKQSFWSYAKSYSWLYFMMLPGLLALILFSYVPMYGVVIAFQDFNIFEGYWGSEWVGLKHFKTLFSDPYFFRLLKNTFRLGATNFLFTFPAPIVLALIINECRFSKYKKVVQSISYLPHFIPMVIMVGIMYEFFGSYGIVNDILGYFGIKPISFFSRTQWFYPLYIGSSIWKGIGWGSIVTLFVCSLYAYPLTLEKFRGKKFFNILLLIPMFISGGMIPTYLQIVKLGLINTRWAMILPGAISSYYVILFRTNFKSIPPDLRESAIIDGASEFRVYWNIILRFSIF